MKGRPRTKTRRSQPKGGTVWLTGLLTLIGSVVATLVVRAAALAVLDIPSDFLPLMTPAPTIFLTVVGVILGVAVFAEMRRVASRPIRLFRIVAGVGLLLSFLPDVWLLTDAAGSRFPGATISGVGTLMVQHVAAAAVVVWMLTMRGAARLSPGMATPDD